MKLRKNLTIINYAGVAELADAVDLGACAELQNLLQSVHVI